MKKYYVEQKVTKLIRLEFEGLASVRIFKARVHKPKETFREEPLRIFMFNFDSLARSDIEKRSHFKVRPD